MARWGPMVRHVHGESARQRGAREARWDSLWLTLAYAGASSAWVLFSDSFVLALGLPDDVEALVASLKGVAFVLVTSAILYAISVKRLTKLYASEVRSARLFQQAGDSILAVRVERDDEGRVKDLIVRDANPVSAERFGLSREQLVGRRRSQLQARESRMHAYFDLVREGVERGEVVRSEIDLGDGVYELGMAYPIEENLWAVSGMDVSALREAQLELRRQEERIRQAYVDVLDAVTGGKLVVMTEEEIEQELGEPLTERLTITSPGELAQARENIRRAVARLSPRLSEGTELLSAVGEALNNALKHAHGGEYRVFARDGRMQVCVSDLGPGIDFRTLPKATLVPGFSTAQTLGMGFTIMLQLSDRVLISTHPGQTEVVLEMSAV